MRLVFCFCVLILSTANGNEAFQKEAERSYRYMLRNISPAGTVPGTVVAATSKQEPDYFFHWVRDAALVMDNVVERYRSPASTAEKTEAAKLLKDYLSLSRSNQTTADFGEPKFLVTGAPFTGPWGRPQNDGPALRAVTLTKLAEQWLAESKEALVRSTLYDAKLPTASAVKADLEFVSHRWRDTCFDLWEEIKGHHFYTRLVQRRALLDGAQLAARLGDTGAGDWYRLQAKQLEAEIARHWDGHRRIVVPTLDRDGGIDYKNSGLDASVILAALHAPADDGFFDFTDDRMLATFLALRDAFVRLYPINGTAMPGAAIGRYPEDRYDGVATGREGNPWALLTFGFGEFLYRSAYAFERRGEIVVSALNQPFFAFIDGAPSAEGSHIRGVPLKVTLEKMRKAGDEFIERARRHAKADGRYSEQINRHSGFMQGAEDLTWSYASYVSAIRARSQKP